MNGVGGGGYGGSGGGRAHLSRPVVRRDANGAGSSRPRPYRFFGVQSAERLGSGGGGLERPGMRRVLFGNNQSIDVPNWSGRRK